MLGSGGCIAGVMLVNWSYHLFIYTVSDSFDIQII